MPVRWQTSQLLSGVFWQKPFNIIEDRLPLFLRQLEEVKTPEQKRTFIGNEGKTGFAPFRCRHIKTVPLLTIPGTGFIEILSIWNKAGHHRRKAGIVFSIALAGYADMRRYVGNRVVLICLRAVT